MNAQMERKLGARDGAQVAALEVYMRAELEARIEYDWKMLDNMIAWEKSRRFAQSYEKLHARVRLEEIDYVIFEAVKFAARWNYENKRKAAAKVFAENYGGNVDGKV